MKKKEILVTGGAGYIGSHTVVELIHSGYTPVLVDDYRNSHEKVLAGIYEISGIEVQCHQVDVADKLAMKSIFEMHSFDGIIHFAADKAVGESVENPLKYYRNNIGGLVTILELALEYNVQNFVFSSSCTVYGEPEGTSVVTELAPQQEANSPYGATKQMGERILMDVLKSGAKINVLFLRYFNPVGAHPSGAIGELPLGRPNNLLPYVTQTGIGKLEQLTVFGNDYQTEDGTCIRDYIHVVDLAKAHVMGVDWLSKQDPGSSDIVNLGTGKGTSVLQIINTFEEITESKLNWKFGPRRAGDVEQIYADASRAEKVLGWKAKLTIADAIKDAWNWEQKQK